MHESTLVITGQKQLNNHIYTGWISNDSVFKHVVTVVVPINFVLRVYMELDSRP